MANEANPRPDPCAPPLASFKTADGVPFYLHAGPLYRRTGQAVKELRCWTIYQTRESDGSISFRLSLDGASWSGYSIDFPVVYASHAAALKAAAEDAFGVATRLIEAAAKAATGGAA